MRKQEHERTKFMYACSKNLQLEFLWYLKLLHIRHHCRDVNAFVVQGFPSLKIGPQPVEQAMTMEHSGLTKNMS